jgi:hypothetical protein
MIAGPARERMDPCPHCQCQCGAQEQGSSAARCDPGGKGARRVTAWEARAAGVRPLTERLRRLRRTPCPSSTYCPRKRGGRLIFTRGPALVAVQHELRRRRVLPRPGRLARRRLVPGELREGGHHVRAVRHDDHMEIVRFQRSDARADRFEQIVFDPPTTAPLRGARAPAEGGVHPGGRSTPVLEGQRRRDVPRPRRAGVVYAPWIFGSRPDPVDHTPADGNRLIILGRPRTHRPEQYACQQESPGGSARRPPDAIASRCRSARPPRSAAVGPGWRRSGPGRRHRRSRSALHLCLPVLSRRLSTGEQGVERVDESTRAHL